MKSSAARTVPTALEPACARLAAFCTPGTEIFQSIVYQPQIWTVDPFDVETIHAEARERFASLLARAGAATPATPGRLLLLHGEAGSGKTHLMRAFRGMTHADGAGYFAYLQMTTEAGNYGRYLLANLVSSLDQPYHPPFVEASGLMRLSTAVFDAVPDVSAEDRAALRDDSIPDPHSCVHEYADRLLLDPRLAKWQVDLDLMRALLHLQRQDPRIRGKILKWLRCEDLSTYDRAALGDLVPRVQEQDPLQMVAQFGRLMAALQEVPLVVCVDQLEDMFSQDMAPDRFRRVVDTLVSLLDLLPNVVVVLSCLEDYYVANKQHLARSKIDRLERDPEPIRLTAQRGFDDVQALLARRLGFLYEEAGLESRADPPVYPFRPEHLRPLVNLTARNILDNCRRHHDRCIALGMWVEPDFASPAREVAKGLTDATPAGAVATSSLDLEAAWNDHLSQPGHAVPDDEAELADLLAWGIEICNAELPPEFQFIPRADGHMINVDRLSPGNARDQFLVAICNKSPQGGGLGRQVSEVETKAAGLPVVLVRSYAFPKDPRSIVAKQIGKLIGTSGRRAEIEDSDWRALVALRSFRSSHAANAAFMAWQRAQRPLSQLAGIRKVLALDRLSKAEPAAKPAPVQPHAAKASSPAISIPLKSSSAPDLALGRTRGVSQNSVRIQFEELKQHMAFLGGSGSGKTTAALLLIEQLLLAGIPVILIDRKGDLCRYADPEAWESPGDSAMASKLAELRKHLDVVLYTPGAPEGRPLAIPVVPDDLGKLSSAEREQLAEFAAASLGAMMGYRPGRAADMPLQVILSKAIVVLAEASDQAVTLESLYEAVASQDPSLMNAVNGYEAKHYRKLAENLLTLRLGQKRVLGDEPGVERLDIDSLLGRGPTAKPGKTRLSIISTQFLGAAGAMDFWVSQFLIALDRWRTRSPSDHLQAVVLLDEADQYLPAVRQPATKAPLENLLRRARSAGIGLMLATQSPGDLDYRCRENIRAWLVGRVGQTTAIAKLKPLFADTPLDLAAKLPAQQAGEFYLLREREVVPLRTDRSVMETKQLPEQRILELARG